MPNGVTVSGSDSNRAQYRQTLVMSAAVGAGTHSPVARPGKPFVVARVLGLSQDGYEMRPAVNRTEYLLTCEIPQLSRQRFFL